ncbi:MAG: cytochrome c [Defluviicoccus sp.]|nr:cytochrome c [Defluviicoccus sp.]MDE0385777.1 cytochrome c [Defluviicoccus sp.]
MRRFLAFLALLPPAAAFAGHELENRDLVNGRALYQEHCASCHGAELEGQPNWRRIGEDGLLPAPPHDRTGHTWHHDNRLLFDYTKLGGKALMAARGVSGFKSGMEGFGDALSDDEIWDILAYIRSTWPERIKRIQASRNPPHDR